MLADAGRGWRPVPGSTGEYHSDMPDSSLMHEMCVCSLSLSSPCSAYIGTPNAIDVGLEVCRQRSGESKAIERDIHYIQACLSQKGEENIAVGRWSSGSERK